MNINVIDGCFAISVVPISDEETYFVTIDQNLSESSNVDEALNDSLWKNSMDNEYKRLIDKRTWEVILPPKNANIVGNKWVFIWK